MKKTYFEYIDKFQKTEIPSFPFSNDEVRAIIERGNLTLNKSSKRTTKMKGVIKMTIISSFIMGIILSGLFFFNNGKPPDSKNQKSLFSKSVIKSNQDLTFENSVKNEETKTVTKIKSKVESPDEFNQILKQMNDSNDKMKIWNNITSNMRNINLVTTPIIVLNDNELENLNIKKTDSGYSFISESRYDLKNDWRREGDELTLQGYPNKGINLRMYTTTPFNVKSRKFIKYDGWNMSKSSGIYPVVMHLDYKKDIGSRGSASHDMGDSPLFIADSLDRYVIKDADEAMKNTLKPIFDKGYFFTGNEFLEFDKKDFPFINQLVPVLIKNRIVDKENTYSVLYLWYVPTKAFIERLPERYNKMVKQWLTPREVVSSEAVDFSKFFKPVIKPKFVENIAGIEHLELTKEELEKIGIKYESGKYTCISEERFEFPQNLSPEDIKKCQKMNYDTTIRKGISRTRAFIDTFEINLKNLEYTGWDMINGSPLSPVAITSVANTYKHNPKYNTFDNYCFVKTRVFNDSPIFDKVVKIHKPVAMGDDYIFKPLMDKLLPVYILIGDNKTQDFNKRKYAEVNIWFYASKEFVELLPERYKTPIMNELELISNIESGKIGFDEACSALKGEKSYFDLCRMVTGIIKDVVIYPNPLENNQKINVQFTLTEKSNLKFELYDNSGRFIIELVGMSSYIAGENIVPIPLKHKLEQGIFLLTISNDKGEKAVQKLIVK